MTDETEQTDAKPTLLKIQLRRFTPFGSSAICVGGETALRVDLVASCAAQHRKVLPQRQLLCCWCLESLDENELFFLLPANQLIWLHCVGVLMGDLGKTTPGPALLPALAG
jgi:hypothetical protein